MKLFATVGALSAVAVKGNEQCDRHVELMLLQDASTSFYELGTEMASSITRLLSEMDAKLGSAYASVAIFSDKPVPFRGNGNGRGYPGEIDICYGNKATYALGNDPAEIKQGYDAIYNNLCEGGDFPENPYEAMIYAALDPKVKWSAPDAVYDTEGKRIVKVMVTVTDDHPHYYGDSSAGIYSWNPLAESDGDPRFWDADFGDMAALYAGSTDSYIRLVELHDKPELTDDETVEFNQLLEFVGPAKFPEPLDHPGTFEASKNCAIYEYPKLEQVGQILNEQNVVPVVIVSGQSRSNTGKRLCANRGFEDTESTEDWLACLTAVYEEDFRQSGVKNYLVGSYGDSADELINQIITLVDRISRDVSCSGSTPVPPVTTSATGETTTTITTEKATTTTTSPEETTTSPTTAATTSSDKSTTTSPEETTTTNEETTEDTTTTSIAEDTTTTATSTTERATTTTIASTTEEETSTTTEKPTTSSTIGETSTTTIASTTEEETSTTSQKPTTSGTSDETSTTASDGESTSTESTETSSSEVPPIIVPPAAAGSNTGMIAGAAGGSVAGVAAVAGVLYKKFGASLLGGSSSADMAAVEQVEVPETPVEREAYEEVTMDMFQ